MTLPALCVSTLFLSDLRPPWPREPEWISESVRFRTGILNVWSSRSSSPSGRERFSVWPGVFAGHSSTHKKNREPSQEGSVRLSRRGLSHSPSSLLWPCSRLLLCAFLLREDRVLLWAPTLLAWVVHPPCPGRRSQSLPAQIRSAFRFDSTRSFLCRTLAMAHRISSRTTPVLTIVLDAHAPTLVPSFRPGNWL